MERCDHKHLDCPKHEGSFDCLSFCEICEGNQEYCPEGCQMVYLDYPRNQIVYVKKEQE